MDKAIEVTLAQITPLLAMRGVMIDELKPIDWGVQLRLSSLGEKATLNIYYSAKRGVSMVPGARPGSGIKSILEEIVGQVKAEPEESPIAKHEWKSWIGSDECGKGDYFGPLVVCAFWADQSMLPRLKKLGICDSKQLKDSQIVSISESLYREFCGRMNGIVLKPQRYNQIIADMKGNQRNLNDLLAWQHLSAVQGILDTGVQVEGILIDQFSKAKKASILIKKKNPGQNAIERTGAESDLAVAAASILARYQFLKSIKEMKSRYKSDFPLGASSRVDQAARDFVKTHGPAKLADVAKLHFKNTQRII